MARFGKKADLDEQKSTKDVECLISVSDDNCMVDQVTGEPISYYVEAQRLQDQVNPDDAKDGKADSNPYITNRKVYYYDARGQRREKTDHAERISAFNMEAIKNAASNEFDTVKTVLDSVTGEEKQKIIHNYAVKVNIGFDARQKTAFFYPIKVLNGDATSKDVAYNERNRPKAGRVVTQDILDKHNEITKLSKDAASRLYGRPQDARTAAAEAIVNSSEQSDEDDKSLE
jgi:hypothetical protein